MQIRFQLRLPALIGRENNQHHWYQIQCLVIRQVRQLCVWSMALDSNQLTNWRFKPIHEFRERKRQIICTSGTYPQTSTSSLQGLNNTIQDMYKPVRMVNKCMSYSVSRRLGNTSMGNTRYIASITWSLPYLTGESSSANLYQLFNRCTDVGTGMHWHALELSTLVFVCIYKKISILTYPAQIITTNPAVINLIVPKEVSKSSICFFYLVVLLSYSQQHSSYMAAAVCIYLSLEQTIHWSTAWASNNGTGIRWRVWTTSANLTSRSR